MNNILSSKYSVAFYSMCKLPNNMGLWRIRAFPLTHGAAGTGSCTWDGVPVYVGMYHSLLAPSACSLLPHTPETEKWEVWLRESCFCTQSSGEPSSLDIGQPALLFLPTRHFSSSLAGFLLKPKLQDTLESCPEEKAGAKLQRESI